MTASPTVLGMFAKAWLPGQVKTRLAATVGENRAAEIHRLFVAHWAEKLASGSVSGQTTLPGVRVLAYSPPSHVSLFHPFASMGWRLEPQSDGNLGRRMSVFFQRRLRQEPYAAALLIGSDSPDLPLALIAEATRHLETRPVVLVPSEDGGYCLVGMNRWIPEMFEDISWSTAEVLRQTRARLEAAAIPYAVTTPWYDVDNQADLDRLLANLQAMAAIDPAAEKLHTQLRRVLN